LLPLSQLLFLFFENRFRAVMRSFSVRVQSRYSFQANPLAGQAFLPGIECRLPMGMLNRANAVPDYLFRSPERAPGSFGRSRQNSLWPWRRLYQEIGWLFPLEDAASRDRQIQAHGFRTRFSPVTSR
jgi:hypothetical protein